MSLCACRREKGEIHGSLLLVAVLVYVFTRAEASSSCGGYIEARSSGVLSTPNHPAEYNNKMHCVWLLEADVDYTVTITIPVLDMRGAQDAQCGDKLEVRAGGADSALLYLGCNSSTPVVLTSPSRWLWLRVYSNEFTTHTGFNATWSVTAGGTTADSPITTCAWTHYECANKECINWAWVCDGYNDCGCTANCDENNCGGFNMSYNTMLAIGIGSGCTVFIIVLVIIVVWEYFQRKKAKQEEDERMQTTAKLKKQKDNKRAMKETGVSVAPSVANTPRTWSPCFPRKSDSEATSTGCSPCLSRKASDVNTNDVPPGKDAKKTSGNLLTVDRH